MNAQAGWKVAHLAALAALGVIAFLIIGSCATEPAAEPGSEADGETEGPTGVAAQALVWSQGQTLTAQPSATHFGIALDMSPDGNRLIVGNDGNGNNVPVLVYEHAGNDWNPQPAGALLPQPGCDGGFGESVAIDGDIALVGAPSTDNVHSDGALCRFSYDASAALWSFVGTSTAWPNHKDYGRYVAYRGGTFSTLEFYKATGSAELVIDSNQFAISTFGYTSITHPIAVDGMMAVALLTSQDGVKDYYKQGGSWFAGTAFTTGSGARSVALSGNIVAVGRPSDAVEIYEKAGANWNSKTVLAPWDGSTGGFGTSVAMTNTHLVVGSPGDDSAGNDTGAVYVFKKSAAGTWTQDQKLTDASPSPNQHLGATVAAAGSWIAAGAPDTGNGKVVTFILLGAPGDACSLPSECASGFCVDEFCCDEGCGDACRACSAAKNGGQNGTCSNVLQNTDPDGECPGTADCNGAGACELPLGQACATDAQCQSAHCVDGLCCDAACGGLCEACNLAVSPGTCTKIPAGTDPASECPGNASCNGQGACALLSNGTACSLVAECQSGFCTDGVCCSSACNGLCVACNLAPATGTCSPIPAGTDPASECAGAAICNGAGACVLANGQACIPGTNCASGFCVDGFCCDEGCGDACRACSAAKTGGQNGTCSNVLQNTDPDGECPGAADCNGAGACELPLGQACATDAQCQSAHCVDGVCCNDACTGTCHACSTAKTGLAAGQCGFVTAGADPDNECTGAGGDVCNGAGACAGSNGQTCSNGGQCLSGYCYDGVCCNAACGGLCEACNLAVSPGNCTKIPAGTDPASECPGNASCNGQGACALLSNGTACSFAAECQSGFCADGTCCNTPCDGACEACGASGQCIKIAMGLDPDDECPGSAVCNGTGGCVKAQGAICVVGAECASGACVDGFCCNESCAAPCRACSAAKTGDANGTCGYVKAGTDPDADCAGLASCNGAGACEAPLGQACSANSECQSKQCVEGLCCNTACSGTCRSCLSVKTGQADGQCAYVTAGTDPDSECSGAAGDLCNGAGACTKAEGQACASGGECLSGHCYDGVCCNATCNGVCKSCALPGSPGQCVDIPAGSDPDGECSGGTTCDGAGACTQLVTGETCSAGVECKSGFCVDGVCCGSACGEPCKACAKGKTGWADGACAMVLAGTDPDSDCAGAGICNGGGACVGPNGASCAAGSACLSGFCVDGVCCESACGDLCHACSSQKTDTQDGTCAPVSAGSDPDNECDGDDACDGADACKKALGDACSGGAECLSDRCVDGVCCNTACDGVCEACDLPGSTGTCTYHPAGTDPEDECVGGVTCGGDGACGPGLELGVSCGVAAECLSGFCVDGVCCETACDGLCEACSKAKTQQKNGTCTAVQEGSDPDTECPGTEACDGAFACKPAAGVPCSDGAECLSGFCVDGVCCNTACGGGDLHDCQACSAAAGGPKDGTCLPVTAAAGVVCRPAASDCDAAETCSGDTIVCPGDEPVAAGEACDDGDPLTEGDICDGHGTCAGNTDCDDENPCTVNDVWQADGSCAGAALADGTLCDDGNACSQGDTCKAGVCSGASIPDCPPPDTGWGGGGCVCSAPGEPPRAGGWPGLFVGLAALAGLRIRRNIRRARGQRAPLE